MSASGTSAVLRQALAWHREGRGAALATVVATWGSAPRGPGSHMVACGSGDFAGSVSGGCVEVAVVEEARAVLATGQPRVVEFGVADEDAWAVGLACGGRIRILVEPVGPGGLAPETLEAVVRARDEGAPVVLASGLSSGRRTLYVGGPADPVPDTAGAGGAAVPAHALREALVLDRAGAVEVDGEEVFLRPHNPPVRVVVVGAVHLAQALVPLARATGFLPVVVDPRDDFATEERFPGVPLVHTWPGEALRGLALDHRTAVVVVTHDPKLDDPALVEALASPAFYVGALGSRRTHARRLERLGAAGLSESTLGRIHAPVGLDIGARTPEEIAVAIVAEIVGALRSGATDS